MAVRAHRDQVGAPLIGELHDLVRRLAVEQDGFGLMPSLANRARTPSR
jgi:hypothetical protein